MAYQQPKLVKSRLLVTNLSTHASYQQLRKELNNFIKTNKHLPNIPSAKEVTANGIELSSMNAKLLEKIEELTLYILQQQKENELMKRGIEGIKKMIGNLK